MRKSLLMACCLAAPLTAQAAPWQPSPGHTQLPLWPGAVPDSLPAQGPEQAAPVEGHLVAGKPWTYVRNVSRPTITVYSPTGTNTGAAIVVFPGGGYQILAIDLEGTEVCDWLVARGITCVLLKYRVPKSGPSWQPDCKCRINPIPAPALEDAQRAMGLVRLHAVEWHIDPHKIGVLGFSAGGHLVAAISNGYQHRLYATVDAADSQSARPDFAVALYPGHLWRGEMDAADHRYSLNPDIHVTKDTPPTFLLQAETDSVDNVNQALVYYIALKDLKVPVEMHLYTNGGHGFGLRRTKDPITEWPRLVEEWLKTIGVLTGSP
ncbi:MAG TPA: alpha/beta hydrolase [Gemmatimonadales bacterium]|nr:alpha/beta hydrolase [Gemmatimonadales bacterium]